MKNYILVFFILLAVAVCKAQSPFDPPSITTQNSKLWAAHNDSTRLISFTDTSIFAGEAKTFMFGHQWFNAVSGVNKRLYMNSYTNGEGNITPAKVYKKLSPTDSILLPSYSFPFERYPRTTGKPIYINYYDLALTFPTLAFQCDPEAPSTGLNESFIPTSGDTSGAIFGFGEKRGGYRLNNRYLYKTDSVPAVDSSTGIVILSKPVGGEAMHRIGGDSIEMNGTRWYLAINLRRSDTTWDNITGANDTILTIKLPYNYEFFDGSANRTAYTSIIFDSVTARNLMLVLDTANYARGGWMDKKLVAKTDSVFAIRRSMLPKYNSTTGDITLSAFFRTLANPSSGQNRPFRIDPHATALNEIDTLGMEVRYFPKCNIAIDWIRLETPDTRLLFRGLKDSSIAELVSHDFQVVKRARDSVDSNNVYVGIPGIKIFRFYCKDEPPRLMYRAARYMSYLFEKYYITEGGFGIRYTHCVPQPSHWGSVPRYLAPDVRVPYAKYGLTDAKFVKHNLGIKGGWENSWNLTSPDYNLNFRVNSCDSNRDGSAYEKYSQLFSDLGWLHAYYCNYNNSNWVASPLGLKDTAINTIPNPDDTIIVTEAMKKTFLYTDPSLLAAWEASLMGYKEDPSFIFSTKPWYSNIWITSEWFLNHPYRDTNNRSLQRVGCRANTGEEIRLSLWTALTFGAKGLMYDHFDNSYGYYDSTNDRHWIRIGATAEYVGIDTAVLKSDTSGNFLLRSDASGSDFIQHNEPMEMNKYCKLDSTGIANGVDSNRIYIGRKSQRLEVMKVHDRIHIIEDTLMRLQLMGWYGKGHFPIKIYRDNDSTYLTKYLRLDSGYLKTKSCVRNLVEGWDSTFCDIMIHKDTSVSMDSVFYVGVMNRRTNPLMRHSDTTDLQFYTTAEFDSLTNLPDTIWRNRRYKQGGSRELSLPFNYKDANGRYALLRVSELGGGIDTVIGQDRAAVVKLLPGEGKMLKVQILRPNEVDGELAHSNQTKMCVYPIMRQDTSGTWQESDSIVHYLTYHKQIPGRSTGYTGVYFRKSRPSSKYDNSAAIQWNSTEYLLSDSVYQDNYWNWCDTCAYPSIVTRFDSLSEEYRSYIVYGCKPDTIGGNINKQYIVESVVRVANDTVVVGNWRGKSFATVPSSNLSEWGTPMINASDTVNFYCWSDPQKGICVGWKRPNTNPVQLEDTVLNIHWSVGCSSYTAQHPSMNPYSRFMRGEHESDCALVWQEKCGCYSAYPDICYTRLFVNHDGHVVNDLSPVFHNGDSDSNVLFNADTSIVVVSYRYSTYPSVTSNSGTFPVVNRDVFLASADTNICSAWISNYDWYSRSSFRFDKIYWQNHSDALGFISGNINSRFIWSQDSSASFIPRYFDMWSLHSIWSSGKYFDQAVVSVGDAYDYSYIAYDSKSHFNCFNYSPRSINLNFRSRPITFTGGLYDPITSTINDTLGQILHFPQSMFAEFSNTSVSIVDYGLLSYPHLAERGSMNQSDWQRNHRIYNKRDNNETIPAPPATIRSSGQYYFRTSDTELIPKQFYSFGDDSLNFGISSVILNEHEYPIKENAWESQFGLMKSSDTVFTDWFNIDNIATMDVSTTGTSPERLSVWLERRSDGTTWDVPLTAGEQWKIKLETVDLINGDNEEYRVQICSYNNAPYRPETAITSDDDEASFGKSADKEHKTIDLGAGDISKSVFIYPNPAREEVNIIIKGTERSEVVIVSAIGGEQTRFVAEGGKTAVLNTSHFASGVYVARVRRKDMVDVVVPFIVVR